MPALVLERVLRTELLAGMRRAVPKEDWHEFRIKNVAELLIIYLAWQMRLPRTGPRRLHPSDAFTDSRAKLDPTARRRLDRLVWILETGGDVEPFLSKRARTAWGREHPRKPNPHRVHLDTLLFGWGIHHIHLRTGGGGDELLFAILHDEDAYLIDVGGHDHFDDEALLHTAVTTWKDAGLFQSLKGATLAQQPRPGDLALLRDAGVATLFEVDGVTYMPPGGGLTTAATPMRATESANAVMHQLRRIDLNPEVELARLFGGPTRQGQVNIVLRGPEVQLVAGIFALRLA